LEDRTDHHKEKHKRPFIWIYNIFYIFTFYI
jgi:hypothetical protein